MLQWAGAHGCPWDESTCGCAAFSGHLAVLQWARERDCPWDEYTCSRAAQGGHLEVLQWARANGAREHLHVHTSTRPHVPGGIRSRSSVN